MQTANSNSNPLHYQTFATNEKPQPPRTKTPKANMHTQSNSRDPPKQHHKQTSHEEESRCKDFINRPQRSLRHVGWIAREEVARYHGIHVVVEGGVLDFLYDFLSILVRVEVDLSRKVRQLCFGRKLRVTSSFCHDLSRLYLSCHDLSCLDISFSLDLSCHLLSCLFPSHFDNRQGKYKYH
jgi:hypothetical protein